MATKEEWKKRFAEQKRSGLSTSSWCNQHGIKANQFFYWRKRLSDPNESEGPSQFIRLDKVEPVEVVVGENIRIRVPANFDSIALKKLLGVFGC